jgi:Rieske Fe-S protein
VAGCGANAKADPVPGIKGQELAKTADVPVGGGVVVDKYKIVVTQPAKGVFKAYSAICTHQGCVVGSPEKNVMTCGCHGSEFAADSGKAIQGPATAPLAVCQVKVVGDGVVVA